MSSSLFQIIREEHGLAYNISSHATAYEDVGCLTISAGLETERLQKALKLIMRELSNLATKLAGAAELRRARDYVIGTLDLSLENTENQMMWLGEQFIGYGKIETPAQHKDRIAEVTPAEVRAAAREFFQPSRINLALVSPLENSKGLDRLLIPPR